MRTAEFLLSSIQFLFGENQKTFRPSSIALQTYRTLHQDANNKNFVPTDFFKNELSLNMMVATKKKLITAGALNSLPRMVKIYKIEAIL